MRVLFLSAWYPYPPSNGSKLRVYNLLRGLAERHEVDLVTFTQGEADGGHPAQLRQLCNSIVAVPKPAYHAGSMRAIAGLLSPQPRYVVDTYMAEFAGAVRQAASRSDVVVASELTAATYGIDGGNVPALFDDLEIGAFRSARGAAVGRLRAWRHELTLLKLRRYLRGLLPRFAACTVVSEAESQLLHSYVPGYRSVEVVPNCVDVAGYESAYPDAARAGMVFTGSFRYAANYEAAKWFVGHVLPLVQAQVPGAGLAITGDHAGLPLPTAPGVELTGHVADIRPLISGAAVSVVPLQSGGGTRLKILEAMALHTPVISTSKGAEGLQAEHGRHLLVADSPKEFADAVVLLLRDRRLAAELAANAYELVSERYDWAGVLPRFVSLVERVAAG